MSNEETELQNLKGALLSTMIPVSNISEEYLRYAFKHTSKHLFTKAITELIEENEIIAEGDIIGSRTFTTVLPF